VPTWLARTGHSARQGRWSRICLGADQRIPSGASGIQKQNAKVRPTLTNTISQNHLIVTILINPRPSRETKIRDIALASRTGPFAPPRSQLLP